MDYRDFVEQVKEQIREYLPEKFRNAEISVHEIIKNNDCRLDGHPDRRIECYAHHISESILCKAAG